MLDRTSDLSDVITDAAPASPTRAGVTAFYRAVVEQLHTRIRRLGLPMWRCDDLSGLQDGYTAKLLHPDTPSGRQARWETLQLLVDALFPDGYQIIIKPLDAKRAAKLQPETNPVVDARVRSIMSMMGRKGGLKSWEVRRAKLTAAEQKMMEQNPRRARRRFGKKLGSNRVD
jgi:hypothetical protein